MAIKEIAGFAFSNASKSLSFRSSTTAITLSMAGRFSSIAVLTFRRAVCPVSARNLKAAAPFAPISSSTGRTLLNSATARSLNDEIAGTAFPDKV